MTTSIATLPVEDLERRQQVLAVEDLDAADEGLIEEPQDLSCAIDFFSIVLQQSSCTCPTLLPDDDGSVGDVVQILLQDLKRDGKARSVALQKLYRLTDRERRHNRIPIICTTKFNATSALVPCLAADVSPSDRRRALLLIANLSIPEENKAVILLTETIDELLPALMHIIHTRLNDAYLAVACLFNLSYLDDAKVKFLSYVSIELENSTIQDSLRPSLSRDSQFSLMRVLEALVVEYISFVSSPIQSVQKEAVRWSMASLRNLVTARENALAVGTTTAIPSIAVQCLEKSNRDLSLWSKDSLEDASLMLLVHMTVHNETLTALRKLDGALRAALSKLHGRGGIHELRANEIVSQLSAASD